LPEELGTVEVWAVSPDGIQANEVRHGQEVAALIDVSLCPETIESAEFVPEESLERQPEGKLPAGKALACVERSTAERGITVDGLHHIGRGRLPIIATLAHGEQQLAGAIALHIII